MKYEHVKSLKHNPPVYFIPTFVLLRCPPLFSTLAVISSNSRSRRRLPEAEMNGNGMMLSIGKGKYLRMDAAAAEGDGETGGSAVVEKNLREKNIGKYVLACAVFASLNSVLLGYDIGVMSGVILFIHEDLKLTEVQQEVLVGCLSIVSLIGSLAGGKTSDAIGRKWTMGLAAIVFQTGALIMTVAPSFGVLMIGRILVGIGIGFGVMVAPVYIAEISPSVTRGSFTSFPEIFINFGILLGYISNYTFKGLSPHLSWRVMLGVGILPSVLIAFALFIIPESPRWLVMQNRTEEARSVLQNISENDEVVELRLAEIEGAAGKANGESMNEDKAIWKEFLRPSPPLRRMLITGIGIQCFQQLTGIDATVYYSPTIFKDAGIKSTNNLLAATVAVGFTKTIFILVAIILIDKVGRKPLLYVSTIGMTACLLGLSLALFFLNNEIGSKGVGITIAILAVCGNVAFFSVGIGPVCWVLSSEIFPLRLRAQAAAIGSVGNRLCSGLIALSFLSVTKAITVGGTFFIFAVLAFLSIVFTYKYVPETKGKSLEEITMMFQSEWDRQRAEVELEDVKNLVEKNPTVSTSDSAI